MEQTTTLSILLGLAVFGYSCLFVMSQETTDLQSTVQSLLLDVDRLKRDYNTLEQQVNALKEENILLKKQCCTTVTNNNSTNILTEVENLKSEHQVTTRSLLDLQARTDRLNDSITQTKLEQTKEQNQASRSAISFNAGLSSDKTGLGIGAKIIYDNIISQVGNGYNPSTGVFTSPVAGTYVFFFSTYTYKADYSIVLDIVCNGKTIVRGRAYDKYNNDAASNLTVMHLYKGSRVWVKRSGGNSAVSSHNGAHLSTFSGFKV